MDQARKRCFNVLQGALKEAVVHVLLSFAVCGIIVYML